MGAMLSEVSVIRGGTLGRGGQQNGAEWLSPGLTSGLPTGQASEASSL